MQIDSTNWVASGSLMFRGYRRSGEESSETPAVDFGIALIQQHDQVLSAHEQALELRAGDVLSYDADAETSRTWDHDYDRTAALAYAQEWVGKRNLDPWTAYDGSGGNCQNYASQVMHAGGIPQDHTGNYQWKWYGASMDYSNTARGRSGSWAGVDEFYRYATGNVGGFGLVAEADVNFWAGEPGDFIQLGIDGRWNHVVVITEVLYDEAGKPVDYLINSNTADLRNYPVSTYMYSDQRLIKIYGWND